MSVAANVIRLPSAPLGRRTCNGAQLFGQTAASCSGRHPALGWRTPAASVDPSTTPIQKPRLRLLTSMARVCEIQGLTTKYELLAGRSAMLGTTTALVVESLTDVPLVTSVDSVTAAALVALAVASVSAAVLSAALGTGASAQGPGMTAPALLEAVVTSLTAVKRSASSVSMSAGDKNVDQAVDDVVQACFTPERMRELTDYEADL